MLEKTLETYGRLTGDPADILRSDVVGVPSESTLSTMELFTFSVSFGNIPTFRASSACILWINVDYGNPCNFGFVRDEALELIESPRMDYSSLATTLTATLIRMPLRFSRAIPLRVSLAF